MRRLFFFFTMSCVVLAAPAQKRSLYPTWTPMPWTEGRVIMANNDTIYCLLRYEQIIPEGTLQIVDGDHAFTLKPEDVKSFYFFDPAQGRERLFYTLPTSSGTGQEKPHFLECLYDDQILSILSHKTMGFAYDYMEFSPFKRKTPVNKRYLLDVHTGNLLPLSRENALRFLVDRKAEIEAFIRKNGLKFKKVSDYISVFEYHSSL
ncbi:MAG: hypothetical protein ACOYXT_27795 [Bacteroidota bacterium]